MHRAELFLYNPPPIPSSFPPFCPLKFLVLFQASLEMEMREGQRGQLEDERINRTLANIHYRLKAIHEVSEKP